MARDFKRKVYRRSFKKTNAPIGILSFTISDGKEVYVRNPYNVGQSPVVYMAIRQPDIAAPFVEWYNYLWSKANTIDPNWPPAQQEATLDELIS